MLLTFRGVKIAVPMIAFVEATIWIFAVGTAIRNLQKGTTEMVYTVVRRRQLRSVMDAIRRWDQDAFASVEEPKVIRPAWLNPARRR